MTRTAEKRDIAGEHITPEQIAALATKFKVTTDVIGQIIRDIATDNIWENIAFRKDRCVICDQIVSGQPADTGRYRYTNTNFGLTSHGRKHVNDGTAFSKFGGATGVYVMPSRAAVLKECERRIRQRRVDRELPKLREARKPFVDSRRQATENREGFEQKLLDDVRKFGEMALRDADAFSHAAAIENLTKEIDRCSRAIVMIEADFDEATVDQLTVGDDL